MLGDVIFMHDFFNAQSDVERTVYTQPNENLRCMIGML